jgi:hypothetical protein
MNRRGTIVSPSLPQDKSVVSTSIRVSKSRSTTKWILNASIAVLIVVVVYLAYVLFMNGSSGEESLSSIVFTPSGKPVQIDVLNGCGVSGVASRMATHLRRHGFDVVEMRNYRSFDIEETLVVDRVGNLALARRVAEVVGVSRENIIQEINPDYYVDVSVVIGRDYTTLRSMN